MPSYSLRKLSEHSGKKYTRWKHVAADLKTMQRMIDTAEQEAGMPTAPGHYQVKVTEYGQLCFRAPHHPDIVGFLWRVNQWKGKSGTGYFGQAVLFPSRMSPALNTHIDYRVEGQVYTAAMPDLGPDEYGEWAPGAHEWQWIEAVPGEYDETMWYQLDVAGEPMPEVNEYDRYLLEEA